MFDRLFTPPSPEEQARRDRQKARDAREKAERRARQAERRAKEEELRKERLEAMPHFRVRQIREVLVQAQDMNDAIALASAAFKEGQDSDYGIKWGKPFGVDGDTKGPIRVINVQAIEDWEDA